MKDLKCGLKSCVHNKGYCCCAKEISVDSDTDCTTYRYDENKANANFEAARKLVTPESAETIHLFETLVGSQSDELKSRPTHFNVSRSEMNLAQDTLFIEGKLFFSNKHKLIRKIKLVLVNREGRWLVDCHDNNIF